LYRSLRGSAGSFSACNRHSAACNQARDLGIALFDLADALSVLSTKSFNARTEYRVSLFRSSAFLTGL